MPRLSRLPWFFEHLVEHELLKSIGGPVRLGREDFSQIATTSSYIIVDVRIGEGLGETGPLASQGNRKISAGDGRRYQLVFQDSVPCEAIIRGVSNVGHARRADHIERADVLRNAFISACDEVSKKENVNVPFTPGPWGYLLPDGQTEASLLTGFSEVGIRIRQFFTLGSPIVGGARSVGEFEFVRTGIDVPYDGQNWSTEVTASEG